MYQQILTRVYFNAIDNVNEVFSAHNTTNRSLSYEPVRGATWKCFKLYEDQLSHEYVAVPCSATRGLYKIFIYNFSL